MHYFIKLFYIKYNNFYTIGYHLSCSCSNDAGYFTCPIWGICFGTWYISSLSSICLGINLKVRLNTLALCLVYMSQRDTL